MLCQKLVIQLTFKYTDAVAVKSTKKQTGAELALELMYGRAEFDLLRLRALQPA